MSKPNLLVHIENKICFLDKHLFDDIHTVVFNNSKQLVKVDSNNRGKLMSVNVPDLRVFSYVKNSKNNKNDFHKQFVANKIDCLFCKINENQNYFKLIESKIDKHFSPEEMKSISNLVVDLCRIVTNHERLRFLFQDKRVSVMIPAPMVPQEKDMTCDFVAYEFRFEDKLIVIELKTKMKVAKGQKPVIIDKNQTDKEFSYSETKEAIEYFNSLFAAREEFNKECKNAEIPKNFAIFI